MPISLAIAAALLAPLTGGDLARAEDLPVRFAAGTGEARLVLIVSPSSASCLRGVRLIEREVLREMAGKPIRTYVVWTPMLPLDTREEAIHASHVFNSIYVEQFWDPTRRLARSYGKLVELPAKREMAWNAYFVHGPKAVWTAEPPTPDDWMHQLGSDERRLSAEVFRLKVEAILGAPPQ